jgi:hypothetical protein
MSHDVLTRRVARWVFVPSIACIAALVQPSIAAFATAPPKFGPPKRYYLSLGDSWGFGLQLEKLIAELDRLP